MAESRRRRILYRGGLGQLALGRAPAQSSRGFPMQLARGTPGRRTDAGRRERASSWQRFRASGFCDPIPAAESSYGPIRAPSQAADNEAPAVKGISSRILLFQMSAEKKGRGRAEGPFCELEGLGPYRSATFRGAIKRARTDGRANST